MYIKYFESAELLFNLLFVKFCNMRDFFINNKYLLILCLISVLGLLIFIGHYSGILIDFGREVYYPEQILNGKVLYKDLFNIYGPLAYQINAILYKIFGIKLSTLYVAGSISAVMIVSCIYLIAEKFLSEFLSFSIGLFTIAVGIMTVSIFNFHFPYSWACLYGILSFLVSLYFLINFSENNSSENLCLSALFAGACAVLKYDFILYCLIVLFFVIKNKNLKAFLFMCFIPFVSFGALFFQGLNFIDIYNSFDIVKNMLKSRTLVYFYQNSGVYFHPKAILTNIVLFLKFVIPFGGFLYGVNFFNKNKSASVVISMLSLILLFYLFDYKISFGFLPLLLLISVSILFRDFSSKLKLLVLSAILVSAKVFWVLLLNSYGVYYVSIILVAIFSVIFKYLPKNLEKFTSFILLLISFIIIFGNLSEYKSTSNLIATSKGKIYTKLSQAQSTNQLVDYINNYTLSNDKILIIPEGLIINFFTKRESDDFYNSFLPLYTETFGVDVIIKHFDMRKPEYIILSNLDMKDYYYRFICQDYASDFCSFILKNYDNQYIIGNDFRYLVFRLKKVLSD